MQNEFQLFNNLFENFRNKLGFYSNGNLAKSMRTIFKLSQRFCLVLFCFVKFMIYCCDDNNRR